MGVDQACCRRPFVASRIRARISLQCFDDGKRHDLKLAGQGVLRLLHDRVPDHACVA